MNDKMLISAHVREPGCMWFVFFSGLLVLLSEFSGGLKDPAKKKGEGVCTRCLNKELDRGMVVLLFHGRAVFEKCIIKIIKFYVKGC